MNGIIPFLEAGKGAASGRVIGQRPSFSLFL
jgi:hypothetical protein